MIPSAVGIYPLLGNLRLREQDFGVLGSESQSFFQVAVSGGQAEFRGVPEAVKISKPGPGIARDHLFDPGVGVSGILVKLGTLKPGELNVA